MAHEYHRHDCCGFIVGLLARMVMPGKQNMSIIMTALLGILGSVVAGYLGAALGFYQPGQGAGWLGSVIGAVIILAVFSAVAKKADGAILISG